MNVINNLEALTQTHYDSGSLSGMASVVHRLTAAGQYPLTIFQADKAVQEIVLAVQDSAMLATPGLAAGTPPAQLHIDLSEAVKALVRSELGVVASGYVVFHATPDTSGFAVQLHTSKETGKPPVFDSHQIGNGDVFAATIFRPGRYSVTNKVNNVQAQIRVSYPVISDTPYSPPDAFVVQLNQDSFQPKDIQLMPAQGVVFHINNTHARIEIDLVEPDDGPVKAQARTIVPPTPRRILPDYRWVKPERPEIPEG